MRTGSPKPRSTCGRLDGSFCRCDNRRYHLNDWREDSIRTLPYLDLDLIQKNPKVFMGFSDTTISHAACFKAGIVSFTVPHLCRICRKRWNVSVYGGIGSTHPLFAEPIGVIEPNRAEWTVEHLPWENPENQLIRRKLNPCTGWRFHQEEGVVEGHLLGAALTFWTGCAALTTSPLPRTFMVLYSSWKPPKRCRHPHF